MAKKPTTGGKPAAKKPAAQPAAKPKAKASSRAKWFDAKSNAPLISQYVERLDPYIAAMADGKIDDEELAAQEQRLTDLMKQVEPMLSDEQHDMVTLLLCELSAYDFMQMLNTMYKSRPKSKFVG